jgi:hypothetical protein
LLIRVRDERADPVLHRRGCPSGDPRSQWLLGLPLGRRDDPGEPCRPGRLDQLRPAGSEQLFPDPFLAWLLADHLLGQPRRELGGVGDRALAETGEFPDLHPVALELPPVPVVEIDLRCRDTDLSGDEPDAARGQIGSAPRKTALPQQMLQSQTEAQAPGAGHSGEPFQLVGIEREVLDQLVFGDRVRHDSSAPG